MMQINNLFITIQILTGPVTTKMRDEALKPFTNAMKETVCETLEEQFREHTQQMTEVLRETAQKTNNESQQELAKVIRQEFKELQKTSDTSQHELPEGRPTYVCI